VLFLVVLHPEAWSAWIC